MTTALAAAQVAVRVLPPKMSGTRLSTTTSRTAPPPTALTTPSRTAEKGAMLRVAAFSVPVTAQAPMVAASATGARMRQAAPCGAAKHRTAPAANAAAGFQGSAMLAGTPSCSRTSRSTPPARR